MIAPTAVSIQKNIVLAALVRLPTRGTLSACGSGTTYRHRGMEEGKLAVDVFAVTHRIKEILGQIKELAPQGPQATLGLASIAQGQ